jgi:hypothetical protein
MRRKPRNRSTSLLEFLQKRVVRGLGDFSVDESLCKLSLQGSVRTDKGCLMGFGSIRSGGWWAGIGKAGN